MSAIAVLLVLLMFGMSNSRAYGQVIPDPDLERKVICVCTVTMHEGDLARKYGNSPRTYVGPAFENPMSFAAKPFRTTAAVCRSSTNAFLKAVGSAYAVPSSKRYRESGDRCWEVKSAEGAWDHVRGFKNLFEFMPP
jgi:hypothetical protein